MTGTSSQIATQNSPGSSEPIFAPVRLDTEYRDDGTLVLRNGLTLPPVTYTLPERLEFWASRRPDQIYLTERRGSGRSELAYGGAGKRGGNLAARLLTQSSAGAPILTLANNGINHALIILAAMRIGIPVAVISSNYCVPTAAPWGKLGTIIEMVKPGLILADDPEQGGEVLRALGIVDVEVRSISDLSWLECAAAADSKVFHEACDSVGLDTVGKFLFTSGSTGTPKGVPNTHLMMVSNIMAVGVLWPFLDRETTVLVDWLPWSHTFGGNFCFNLPLCYGGTLHIDDGRPSPAMIQRSIDVLKAVTPTIYFNVPAGYEALLPHLEADHALARKLLGGVRFLFSAAAPLPSATFERLARLGEDVIGRAPLILGGWGSTETTPASTAVYFDSIHPANLGLPLPGTEIKMVPTGGHMDLLVRGPNVMPGYLGQPEATAAAYDEEGFYRMGDAGRLLDRDNPEKGILYEGRLAENFKLSSGTWVNVSPLRLAVIAESGGLIADAVVTGEGKDNIGLLVFLNPSNFATLENERQNIVQRLRQILLTYNARQTGSSTRIARFRVMEELPRGDRDEITDKGYLNQRAILLRRAAIVDEMYDGETGF